MSLMDRLAGRKTSPNGTASPAPAVPAAPPVTPDKPSVAPPVAAVPQTGAVQQTGSMRAGSSMYSRSGREEEKLSAVDQLKIDLHHRLIERLDLEALEQIKDEVEVVH